MCRLDFQLLQACQLYQEAEQGTVVLATAMWVLHRWGQTATALAVPGYPWLLLQMRDQVPHMSASLRTKRTASAGTFCTKRYSEAGEFVLQQAGLLSRLSCQPIRDATLRSCLR